MLNAVKHLVKSKVVLNRVDFVKHIQATCHPEVDKRHTNTYITCHMEDTRQGPFRLELIVPSKSKHHFETLKGIDMMYTSYINQCYTYIKNSNETISDVLKCTKAELLKVDVRLLNIIQMTQLKKHTVKHIRDDLKQYKWMLGDCVRSGEAIKARRDLSKRLDTEVKELGVLESECVELYKRQTDLFDKRDEAMELYRKVELMRTKLNKVRQ